MTEPTEDVLCSALSWDAMQESSPSIPVLRNPVLMKLADKPLLDLSLLNEVLIEPLQHLHHPKPELLSPPKVNWMTNNSY